MWENPKAVHGKKPNYKKLLEYGFIKVGNEYVFSQNIADNMFTVTVFVSENNTKLKVTDNSSDEEYVPVYIESAVGAFVSTVRSECEHIIEDIADNCFEENIFKKEYTNLVLKYIEEKYGIKAEHPWEDPNAVFREPKSKKWFGVLMLIEYKKIGIDKGGKAEVINFKGTPENIEKLLERKGFLPGFHMNKKYWYTVLLDGTVPIEEIYRCIDRSYELIANKKEKNK